MTSTADYDVVIIGAGIAGLTAAIAAANAGLTALILEKSAAVGGAAAWAYGVMWVPGSDQAIAAGVIDDPAAVTTYVTYITGGENDPERTGALMRHAPATLRFLKDAGVAIDLLPAVGDLLWKKAPGAVAGGRTLEPATIDGAQLGDWRALLGTPKGDAWRLPISVLTSTPPEKIPEAIGAAIAIDQLAQGPSLVAQLMIAARARGVEIRFGYDVAEIVRTAGRVSGIVTADGTTVQAGKAVLLATGAYLSNLSLVARLDSLPGYRSMMPAGSDGDGLRLAAEVGASIAVTRNNLAINVGYEDPAQPGAPLHPASVWEMPRAHMIMVNAKGARFGNEATFQEYAPALRAYDSKARRLKNLPCWLIFDTSYVDRCGFAGSSPGLVPDWVMSASSIAELARRAGIDAEGLVATVDRFATFAESGIDEDFNRVPGWDMQPGAGDGINASLGAIRRAPFYAVKLSPTLQVGGSGIRADGRSRILDWNGRAIPGFYAAGDVALHDDFGTGYQAGLSLVSCLTFAKIAIDDVCQS